MVELGEAIGNPPRLSRQTTPRLRSAQSLTSDALKEVFRKDALPYRQRCLHKSEIVILVSALRCPATRAAYSAS